MGKWVARTQVRDLPPDALLRLASISENDLLRGPEPAQGIREMECRPGARVLAHITPEARAGGGGVDLAAVITVISGNGALGNGDCRTHAASIAPDAARVFAPRSSQWQFGALGVSEEPTQPIGGACRMLPLDGLSVPRMGRLATVLPKFARAPKMPRLAAGADGLPRFRRMVVRNGMGAVSRIPLIRRSLAVDRSTPTAHPEERARLAAMGKTTPDRVLVVGIFPAVPVAVVSRLALEPDGTELRVWLKPEALASGATPKMLTLLVGRDRETGKTIQTVQ